MRWTLRRDLHEEALPGAMKKVLAHAFAERARQERSVKPKASS